MPGGATRLIGTGSLGRAGRVVAGAALVVLLLAVGRLAIGAAGEPFPFVDSATAHHVPPRWLLGPFAWIGASLSPDGGFKSMLWVMCASYVVLLLLGSRVPARWAIAAIVLVHLVVLLGPPINSRDVFGYIGWGREGAGGWGNPFTESLRVLPPHDPIRPYVDPSQAGASGTLYGPLFVLLMYVLAPLPVPVAYWVLRVAAVAASLGSVAFVWRIARARGYDPVRSAMVLGLNPLVLVFIVSAAHNDLLFVVLALAGGFLIVTGRERSGAATVCLAPFIKATSLLIAPFAVLGSRERRRAGAVAAATLVVGAALSVAIFSFHGMHLLVDNLKAQDQVVGFRPVPLSKIAAALGEHGVPHWLRTAGTIVVIATFLAGLWWTWRGHDWIAAAGCTMLALVATRTYFQPWYYLWPIALAAAARSWLLRVITIVYGYFIIKSTISLLVVVGAFQR